MILKIALIIILFGIIFVSAILGKKLDEMNDRVMETHKMVMQMGDKNEFVNICFFCAYHDRCIIRKNLGDARIPRDFKDPTLYCKIFMKNEDTADETKS